MAEGKVVGFKLYRHYLWFAIASGLLVPVSFWLIDVAMTVGGNFWLMNLVGIGLYLVLGSAVVHTSVWSVFGDGGLIKRTLVSLGIFSIVLAGLIVGYAVLSWGSSEFALMAKMGVLLALPLIVAAQVPFWFLRGAFGWQLVRDGEQPVVISLKQLFLITLVFGIAFATPSIAGKVYVSTANANYLTVGSTHYDYVLQEDGSYAMNEIQVTLENRDELLLKQNQEVLMSMNWSMLSMSAMLATLSFLSIPVFWFAFRFGKRKAILYSGLYGFLLCCLVGIGCLSFYGWTYFWIHTAPLLIFGIAAVVFLIVTPLLISKAKGFWLSTGRVRPAEVERKVGPIIDPLA